MKTGLRLKGKLVVLRLNRLGHVPPGWYAAEILHESGLPLVVLEYTAEQKGLSEVPGPLPRFRFGPGVSSFLPSPFRVFASLLSVFRLLWQHVHLGDGPSLLMAHGIQEQLVAWMLWRVTKTPYAVHVHEVYDLHEVRGLARLFLRLEGVCLRNASFLIFPEESRAKTYVERYALKNRIHVVYNCPRLDRGQNTPARNLHQALGIPASHLIVGYMGGIGRTNAIVELIEGLKLEPETTLVLFGWADAPYKAELRQAARPLGPRVLFVGEVEDKWGYLKGCDVLYCGYRPNLLRTRLQATASNKFTESLACGKPVIALAAGGFADAIAKTQSGVTVGELTPQALAVALRGLKNKELRRLLGENGHRAFLRDFHYERQFAPVVETLANIFGLTGLAGFTGTRSAS